MGVKTNNATGVETGASEMVLPPASRTLETLIGAGDNCEIHMSETMLLFLSDFSRSSPVSTNGNIVSNPMNARFKFGDNNKIFLSSPDTSKGILNSSLGFLVPRGFSKLEIETYRARVKYLTGRMVLQYLSIFNTT